MAELPLWSLDEAKRGERDAGPKALRDLAAQLRGTPSPSILEEVADMLERAAEAGPKGAPRALYLAHQKRPKETDREASIWAAVQSLMDDGCPTLKHAYKQVADDPRFKTTGRGRAPRAITAKHVEEIYLKWRKADRDSREEDWLSQDVHEALRFNPEWAQWEQWRREGDRWVTEAQGAYKVGLAELRQRQAEYRRWYEEHYTPAFQAFCEALESTPKK